MHESNKNIVLVCGNKYTKFWIHSTISLEISKIHIFQKFYKMLEKFMFIDKTL